MSKPVVDLSVDCVAVANAASGIEMHGLTEQPEKQEQFEPSISDGGRIEEASRRVSGGGAFLTTETDARTEHGTGEAGRKRAATSTTDRTVVGKVSWNSEASLSELCVCSSVIWLERERESCCTL